MIVCVFVCGEVFDVVIDHQFGLTTLERPPPVPFDTDRDMLHQPVLDRSVL